MRGLMVVPVVVSVLTLLASRPLFSSSLFVLHFAARAFALLFSFFGDSISL